ncbi:MAG: type 4a pilus biogenesis protein PilO [Candidatus Omnitrophota bacterium]
MQKINLSQVDLKYKIIGAIGIIAAVFLIFNDFICKPVRTRISDLKVELEPLQDQLQIIRTLDYPTAEDNEQIIAGIAQDHEDARQRLKIAEQKLVKFTSTADVLKNFTNKAISSQIEIITIKPMESAIVDNVRVIPFHIECYATYNSFFEFIKTLKKLPMACNSLKMFVVANKKPYLHIVLNASLYVRK